MKARDAYRNTHINSTPPAFDSLITRLESIKPDRKQLNNKSIYFDYSMRLKQIRPSHKNYPRLLFILQEMLNASIYPNVIIFNQLISLLGKFKRINEAFKLHQIAVARFIANVVTHSGMITAAGNCGQFAEAKAAYEQAKKDGVADVVTHSSMITVLVLSNRIDEALLLHKQFPPKFTCRKTSTHIDIDLHGLTYGQAYLAFKSIIEEQQQDISICIIYGKGFHSRNAEERAVRRAVERVVDEMRQQIQSYREDENNRGKSALQVMYDKTDNLFNGRFVIIYISSHSIPGSATFY